MENELKCVISGFLCEISKIRDTLWYYGPHSGITLSTFRDNLSDPSWRVKNSKRQNISLISSSLKTGSMGCHEKSVRICNYKQRNIPEEHQKIVTKVIWTVINAVTWGIYSLNSTWRSFSKLTVSCSMNFGKKKFPFLNSPQWDKLQCVVLLWHSPVHSKNEKLEPKNVTSTRKIFCV